MTFDAILSAIDNEIEKLQEARAVLTTSVVPVAKKAVGRPKGSKAVAPPVAKKRVLSDEARAKIAAAQKRRWAVARKAR